MMLDTLHRFYTALPILGILGAVPLGRVPAASPVPPQQLVAEAPIWGANQGFKGYAFLPVTIHGKAGTVVINLEDEGDLALSIAALATAGVSLANTTTLDSLRIGPVVERHIPLRLLTDPNWTVRGPETLPPVIGIVGVHFLSHYDVEYNFPARRVRLYAMPAKRVAPGKAWLPPEIKPSDCGKMVRVPAGAGTFTGMALTLDGHPVTGVLEMGPYYPKMNAAAVEALGLTTSSARVRAIPEGNLPPGYSHNGYPITQQVDSVRIAIGSHTFWTGNVQIFPVLDVETVLPPKTPVMLLNLGHVRNVVLFNSMSSGQVCLSAP